MNPITSCITKVVSQVDKFREERDSAVDSNNESQASKPPNDATMSEKGDDAEDLTINDPDVEKAHTEESTYLIRVFPFCVNLRHTTVFTTMRRNLERTHSCHKQHFYSLY